MRRAFSSLLTLARTYPKFSSQSLPCFFLSNHTFPKCPRRSLQTISSTPPPVSPCHLLDSAATQEELLSAFEALEASSNSTEKNLGIACLKVAQFFYSSGSQDHERTLDYALRALKIMERDGNDHISVAKALQMVGSISFRLKRFGDSLEALDAADRTLSRLEAEVCGDSDVKLVMLAVQQQLGETKIAIGRRLEALVHLRKVLELKKLMEDPDSIELGAVYKSLADTYVVSLDFKEALSMCLKALEIYRSHFGWESVEVAGIRKLLGVIYTGSGEYEEALQQNELARRVFESLELEDDVLLVEIEAANVKIALGRLDEAINTLKGVIQRADKESEIRAMVFVSMAKAMVNQEKFVDARRCLEISCSILDKKGTESPIKVAEAYAEVSMLYEAMNEFETAMSFMKRTLAIVERIPQERHLEGSISARLGWLLLLTGRISQAVPYLESAIERLKESFGLKHFGLGFAYKHLGQAYLDMDQLRSAVKMLLLAKGIIDASFGPQHEDSIDICQCLANAYGAMGSYAIAMEFQQQAVDAWESHGPSFRDDFREAHRLLEQLKKKAHGSPSAVFPANTLPAPPQK